MGFNPQTCIRLEDGSLVTRDVFFIAKTIAERWPELAIMTLRPGVQSDLNDAPYKIVEKCADGNYRQVMEVWALDYSVIHRLEMADTRYVDVEATLDRMVADEKARQAKKNQERNEEIKDIAVTALTQPKQSFTFKREDGRLVAVDK